MHWNQMNLKGWGRTNSGVSQVCRPDRIADISKYMEQVGKNGIIARGLGRSYADQALNEDGAVMLFRRMDRIRSFNEKTGELICEPGITLRDITELFSARGFMFPVTPATGFHTLGGAIAVDIFGSNAHKKSTIAKHINWLEIVTADGETVRADNQSNKDLYTATLGGMGLTGFISLVSISLLKRPAPNVLISSKRVSNLDDLLSAMRNCRKENDFGFAWIDSTAKGNDIGRAVLTTGKFTEDPVKIPPFSMPRIKLPFYLPNFLTGPTFSSFINDMNYRFFAPRGTKIIPFEKFLYPKDRFLGWEKSRGTKGFYQFRFSFSEAEGPQAIRRILAEVSRTKIGSFIATLQLLKEESPADMSFSMKGFCLSLDFIKQPGIEENLKHLETIAMEHKGRISMQNDALMASRNLMRMYKNYDTFKKTLAHYDPQKKFDSDFARRLSLKEKYNEQ